MISKKQSTDAALKLLGVDHLVLAIHDQSFPSDPEEEVGRGSPYTAGGRRFTQFISELGFNGIQLGPQGKTSLSNPSPYDSTLFSKNDLSISLSALANDPDWEHLINEDDLKAAVANCPSQCESRDRAAYTHAWHAQHEALAKAYENFLARSQSLKHLWLAYTLWAKPQAGWLERDSLFEALSLEYGTDDWLQWNEMDQNLFNNQEVSEQQSERISTMRSKWAKEIERFQFCQFVAHQQHQHYRELAGALDLKLYADMQIGFSKRDMWALRHLLLPNYLLGAPPSRTNPAGQPWGYTVLDPALYFEGTAAGGIKNGPAIRYFISRVDKLLLDFDGVRIDHPHGLICPWVYKSSEPDALRAVQNGARLFESPNIPEHEQLSKYALVSPEQLNTHLPRYGDAWVGSLTEDQIDKFGVLIEVIKERLSEAGFEPSGLICEVLSSCPFPLKAVLQRHGLGRFRVTQKANPHNSRDVYRSDNAQPEDWIMVGTHDTKPIWMVVDGWTPDEREAWAQYLAGRLEPFSESERSRMQLELAGSNSRLVEAMFADLFIGPARNISIFFADLLGIKQIYNEPGVISDTNWVLSVPNDYKTVYYERIKTGEAPNLPRILAMAVHAKCGDTEEGRRLVAELDDTKSRAVQS